MTPPVSPFATRPGCHGTVVALSDKRWYLRHWHSHDTLQINLILRGSGHVLLDHRRYPLLPGHLIWLWPGQRHIPAEWSADMALWIVEWQPQAIRRFRQARAGDVPAPADPTRPFCRRLAPAAVHRLDGLLCALAVQSRPDAFNRGLDFALFALWDEFRTAEPVAECDVFHPKLTAALALLADPECNLSQAALARRVHLSPYYLSDLFRRQTGLSVPAYRNRLRLQAFFRRLHEHPEIRLLQHALDAGFGSYAQFHRIFAAALGRSPRAWLRDSRPGTHPVPRPARKPKAVRTPQGNRTAGRGDPDLTSRRS